MVIKGKVWVQMVNLLWCICIGERLYYWSCLTDLDGNYTLANVSKGAILEFSYVGYVKLTKTVGNETTINAILYEDSQMLEGVEVVAFGTQKKESVIGAISTVKVAELKTPSSNLTNALAGRIAGVISYQRTGTGVDDASFFVRGVTTFGYKKIR